MGVRMSRDEDTDLQAALRRAATAMLGRELESSTTTDTDGRVRQDWTRRRRAAEEICRLHGVLDVLRAVSADGELRPPPTWPLTDIVPTGGGTGVLICSVRTFVDGVGVRQVNVNVSVPPGVRITQDQIADAHDRGKWQLKKLIASFA